MQLAWSGPGGNNVTNDPGFHFVPPVSATSNFNSWASAQIMWDWFNVSSASPARSGLVSQGAIRKPGALIWGKPSSETAATSATLRVGINRTGSGIPSAGFPAGTGYSHYKWRLDSGSWSAETSINTPISVTNLASGPHYVEVTGKRDSGLYQDDPLYGSEATITRSKTWVVTPGLSRVIINEVLAENNSILPVGGDFPDAIELYNPEVVLSICQELV